MVADGRGFRMPLTRRLHLAAKSAEANGEPTLLLLLREPDEATAISAASTRWRVSPRSHAASEDDTDFGWTVALHRCRGAGAFAAAFSEPHAEAPVSPRAGPSPFGSLPTAWIDAVSRDPPDRLDEGCAEIASPQPVRGGGEVVRPPSRDGLPDSDHSPGAHDGHVCRSSSSSPVSTRKPGAANAPVAGGDAALVVDRSGEAPLAKRAAGAGDLAEQGVRRSGRVRCLDTSRRPDDAGRRSDPCLPHRHHADAGAGHREIAGGGLGSESNRGRGGVDAESRVNAIASGAFAGRGGSERRAFEHDRASEPGRGDRRAAGAPRARGRRSEAHLPSLFDGLPAGRASGP